MALPQARQARHGKHNTIDSTTKKNPTNPTATAGSFKLTLSMPHRSPKNAQRWVVSSMKTRPMHSPKTSAWWCKWATTTSTNLFRPVPMWKATNAPMRVCWTVANSTLPSSVSCACGGVHRRRVRRHCVCKLRPAPLVRHRDSSAKHLAQCLASCELVNQLVQVSDLPHQWVIDFAARSTLFLGLPVRVGSNDRFGPMAALHR